MFKAQLIWLNPLPEYYLVIRVSRILTKHHLALYDISLTEFECFHNVILRTINRRPWASVWADHVVSMWSLLIIKSVVGRYHCFRMAHPYCCPATGSFKLKKKLFGLLKVFLQTPVQKRSTIFILLQNGFYNLLLNNIDFRMFLNSWEQVIISWNTF